MHCKFMKAGPWLSCSSLYLIHLTKCLSCGRHSTNVCGRMKGRQRRTGIWSTIKYASIWWIPKSCPWWKVEVMSMSQDGYQICIIISVKSKCETQIPWPYSLFTSVAVNIGQERDQLVEAQISWISFSGCFKASLTLWVHQLTQLWTLRKLF